MNFGWRFGKIIKIVAVLSFYVLHADLLVAKKNTRLVAQLKLEDLEKVEVVAASQWAKSLLQGESKEKDDLAFATGNLFAEEDELGISYAQEDKAQEDKESRDANAQVKISKELKLPTVLAFEKNLGEQIREPFSDSSDLEDLAILESQKSVGAQGLANVEDSEGSILTLLYNRKEGRLQTNLPEIRARKSGQEIYIDSDGLLGRPYDLFIEDSRMLTWHPAEQKLRLQEVSDAIVTNIFIYCEKNLIKIPVILDRSANVMEANADLVVPKGLVSLKAEPRIAGDIVDFAFDQGENLVQNENYSESKKESEGGLTSEEVQKKRTVQKISSYLGSDNVVRLDNSPTRFKEIEIRILDERSSKENILAVGDSKVRIVGQDYFGISSEATGKVQEIQEDEDGGDLVSRPLKYSLPVGSSLLLEVTPKEDGAYLPTLYQLEINEKIDTYDVFLKPKSILHSLSEILQIEYKEKSFRSLCASVRGGGKPLSGIEVSTDQDSRIVYFDEGNLPNLSLSASSENGKFCVLGLDFDLLTLNFFKEGNYLNSTTAATSPGFHILTKFDLHKEVNIETHLLVASGSRFEPVDWVDVQSSYQVSSANDFELIEDGHIKAVNASLLKSGRADFLVEDGAYVPTLYDYDSKDSKMNNHVTELVSQSTFSKWVEEADAFNQLAEEGKGHVLLQFGLPMQKIGKNEKVRIALYAANGEAKDVGNATDVIRYNIAEQTGYIKTMYFGLSAGSYQAVLLSEDGIILDSKILKVYEKTLSFKRMGPKLQYIASSALAAF